MKTGYCQKHGKVALFGLEFVHSEEFEVPIGKTYVCKKCFTEGMAKVLRAMPPLMEEDE